MRVPATARLVGIWAAVLPWGCRPPSPVVFHDAMPTFVCDTALKRPLRSAEIPNASAVTGYGALAGIVFRAGTGNGIDSAWVMLSPQDSLTTRTYRQRVTGPTGGFAFDSVVPGRYRLLVSAAWERRESSFVAVASNRIDTVRFAMQAPGLCTRA